MKTFSYPLPSILFTDLLFIASLFGDSTHLYSSGTLLVEEVCTGDWERRASLACGVHIRM